MELNEQEAHCVARLLQSLWYGQGALDGCGYCKYQCGEKLPMFHAIKKRLTDETGVDVSPIVYGELPDSKFPYLKFLKNANETALNYFRTYFTDI